MERGNFKEVSRIHLNSNILTPQFLKRGADEIALLLNTREPYVRFRIVVNQHLLTGICILTSPTVPICLDQDLL